jgi:hypothetical protein
MVEGAIRDICGPSAAALMPWQCRPAWLRRSARSHVDPRYTYPARSCSGTDLTSRGGTTGHLRMRHMPWILGLSVTTFLLTACSSSDEVATGCYSHGGASLCLVQVGSSTYRPMASGLRPGSTVRLIVVAKGLPHNNVQPASYIADASGQLPGRGAGIAIVLSAGVTDVVITMKGTTRSGTAVTARFTG